jgi:hypothetical protein
MCKHDGVIPCGPQAHMPLIIAFPLLCLWLQTRLGQPALPFDLRTKSKTRVLMAGTKLMETQRLAGRNRQAHHMQMIRGINLSSSV